MTTATLVVEFGFAVSSSNAFIQFDATFFDSMNFAPTSNSPQVALTTLTLDDVARGKLDLATLSSLAEASYWTDVTSYATDVTIRRGRNRIIDRYEAGTCQITFNNEDRRFDPTNLSGPYISAGETLIEPMKIVRVRVLYGSTYYPLFYGYVDNWQMSYEKTRRHIAQMSATDGFKVLAGYQIAHDAGDYFPVTGDLSTGGRIDALLTSAGWGLADRLIETGKSRDIDDPAFEEDILSQILLTNDTELGDFYMSANGIATFRNRQAKYQDTRSSTSNFTFDDTGANVPYTNITMPTTDDLMCNSYTAQGVGTDAYTAEDIVSISKYFPRKVTNTGLLFQTDEEAEDHARYFVQNFKNPELRFDSVTASLSSDTIKSATLPREIGDLLTIKRTPIPLGTTITRNVWIQGINWNIRVGEPFEVTYNLADAPSNYLLLGSSPISTVLDTARLGY